MPTDIETAACILNQSQDNYRKAWNIFYAESEPMCSTDRFFEILEHFFGIIVDERSKGGRDMDAVKRAAKELVRRSHVEHYYGENWAMLRFPFSFDEILMFARRWNDMYEELHKVLFDTVTDKGDDSYGDFIDSLPLAGRHVVEKCLEGGYSHRGLTHGINHAMKKRDKGNTVVEVEMVLQGENYFRMSLNDALKDMYPSIVRQKFSRDMLGVIEKV